MEPAYISYIFIWIACAVLTAVGANSKNRDVLGWLFLGILFGIFALAAVLILPALPASEMAPDNTRNCPYCAELVKKEAVICKHCGKEIPAIEVSPKPVVEKTEPKIVCWTCSSYLTNDWDQSKGKCIQHNRKTYASDSCEEHTPKPTRA